MLGILVATLLIAILVNLFLKRFNLPTIIGYILTGTIIAYLFDLHDVVHNEHLKEIAEFGIVFLMFTIGLEFSFPALMKMKKEVFFTGSLQIVVTTLVVMLVCLYFLDYGFKAAMIIGAALALSSTAIVLKTFNETREINRHHGRRVLGILIMQDIAVIPILLMISIFVLESNASIGLIIGETLLAALALISILLLVGKYLLQPFFEHVSRSKSSELFVGSVLSIAMGASYLAHEFGFSYSLGAFIAGMLIAETNFKHQAEADLTPFRNLLLGVFFITVGMQIKFSLIFAHFSTIMILLPLLLGLKYVIIYAIVRLDTNKRVAFKTAVSLVQIGEFSLAILELARNNKLIDPSSSQILIVTIVLSMILTPLILKNLSSITARLVRKGDMELPAPLLVDADKSGHILVLGFGSLGKAIVQELKQQQRDYLILEHNFTHFQEGKQQGEPIIYGNAAQKVILEAVKIKTTEAIIIAIDNPEKLALIYQVLNDLNHDMKTIVKLSRVEELENLAPQHVVIQNLEVAKALVAKIDKLDQG